MATRETRLDGTVKLDRSGGPSAGYNEVVPELTEAPLYVLVAGPPASGKSSLAPALSAALGLPLVAKDTIKDQLLRFLSTPDVEASRELGRAAVAAMLAVAAEAPRGAVIESNFYRSQAVPELRRLPGPIVEVFCRCRPDVAARRYQARAGSRGAGYFDADRPPEELWNEDIAEPVAGGWPVLEVDTNGPVAIDILVARIGEVTARAADRPAVDLDDH